MLRGCTLNPLWFRGEIRLPQDGGFTAEVLLQHLQEKEIITVILKMDLFF